MPDGQRAPVIRRIQERLAGNADIRLAVGETDIHIRPAREGGFEAGLSTGERGRHTVWFEGWHEEFETAQEALSCLAFGLSRQCRLKVFSAGATDYRWVVEYRREGE
jgi:hypothetical protein